MAQYCKYQKQHIDFMRLHNDKRVAEMYALFVAEFGEITTFDSFKTTIFRHKIRDKRVKYSHDGHYTNGSRPAKEKNVGDKVFRYGKWHIKVAMEGKQSERWQSYSHYIWEKKHGKMPENNVIIHLDGIKNNFDIDNLACISRQVHCVMLHALKHIDKSLNKEKIKLAEAMLSVGDYALKRRKLK